MDAFELMRESSDFASFFTSGKRVSADEDDDDFDDDLEEEEHEKKVIKKNKKDDKTKIINDEGNSKDSGNGSFTSSNSNRFNNNKASTSKIKEKDPALTDIEKYCEVEVFDPFSMNEEFLEEMKKYAQEKEVEEAAKKANDTKIEENGFLSNSTETPVNSLTAQTFPTISNKQNPDSTVSKIKKMQFAAKKVRNKKQMRMLNAREAKKKLALARASALTSTTPSTLSTPLSPPIATRIIPARKSATRAIATIKQDALGEKAIERLLLQPQVKSPPVLGTKSMPGLKLSTLTLAVKSKLETSPMPKDAKLQNLSSSSTATKSSDSTFFTNQKHQQTPATSTSKDVTSSVRKLNFKRRPRPAKYATEAERIAASKASAKEFRQRYKERETNEQREFRLKKSKICRLIMKGLFEEAVEYSDREGIPLTQGQQVTIANALYDGKFSKESFSKSTDIQILSKKKAAAEKKETDHWKSVLTVRQSPPKKKVTSPYFGVDKEWDQLVMAQEVAKTSISRAGRQCKAKNFYD